jgi:hypothetical protein
MSLSCATILRPVINTRRWILQGRLWREKPLVNERKPASLLRWRELRVCWTIAGPKTSRPARAEEP